MKYLPFICGCMFWFGFWGTWFCIGFIMIVYGAIINPLEFPILIRITCALMGCCISGMCMIPIMNSGVSILLPKD